MAPITDYRQVSKADLERYGRVIESMADLAEGLHDIRPTFLDQMMVCFAAAGEVMARSNDRTINLQWMISAFECYLRSTNEAGQDQRSRLAAEKLAREPREPLSLPHEPTLR